jgi:hypothetical protein
LAIAAAPEKNDYRQEANVKWLKPCKVAHAV